MDGVHVRVRVGSEQYALAVQHVHEVLELGELTPVPGSISSLLGLRNLGGEILPAFDLARVLQIPSDARPRRLLVVEHGLRRAAFAVDDVLDVGELTGNPQESESPHLSASTVIDGALVGVLAADALLERIAEVKTP